MKALLKLLDTITCKIQEYIMIITCVAVTVLIMVAAAMRYIFHYDFYGSEEIILFTAFWLYFTGSISSSRDDTHITANMVSMFTSNQKVIRAVEIVKSVICILIAASRSRAFAR